MGVKKGCRRAVATGTAPGGKGAQEEQPGTRSTSPAIAPATVRGPVMPERWSAGGRGVNGWGTIPFPGPQIYAYPRNVVLRGAGRMS